MNGLRTGSILVPFFSPLSIHDRMTTISAVPAVKVGILSHRCKYGSLEVLAIRKNEWVLYLGWGRKLTFTVPESLTSSINTQYFVATRVDEIINGKERSYQATGTDNSVCEVKVDESSKYYFQMPNGAKKRVVVLSEPPGHQEILLGSVGVMLSLTGILLARYARPSSKPYYTSPIASKYPKPTMMARVMENEAYPFKEETPFTVSFQQPDLRCDPPALNAQTTKRGFIGMVMSMMQGNIFVQLVLVTVTMLGIIQCFRYFKRRLGPQIIEEALLEGNEDVVVKKYAMGM